MGSHKIVFFHIRIEVHLQGVCIGVELFTKGYRVELVQDRLMEPLTNAVRLRALYLGELCITTNAEYSYK